ncbi:hypothetical protein HGRIS_013004 [Hohenbuehelia grisea]|uniref:F-box domain-containing protein n=1 Tax=Hohenbuehelia grisea TaxID=104357 RepID=A0ABR3IU40_9AGAR
MAATSILVVEQFLRLTRASDEPYNSESFRDLSATNDLIPTASESDTIRSHINAIDSDMRRLDQDLLHIADIAKVIREEAQAARARLMLASSPIRRIPPELLAEIFEHACRGALFGLGPPWTLAMVCQRWRSVALSTARLWSTISSATSDKVLSNENFSSVIELCLQRSGNAPLDIWWFKTDPVLPDAVVSQSSRWRTAVGSRAAFPSLAPGHVPLLEYLHLHGRTRAGESIRELDTFAVAPRLREVHLTGISWHHTRLPIKQLEIMEVRFTSPWAAYTDLPQLTFSNLTSLKPHFRDEHPIPPSSSEPVCLPNLKSLILEPAGLTPLLDLLCLPKLHYLFARSQDVEHGPNDWQRLAALITRSACHLKILSVGAEYGPELTAQQFAELLAVTPHLTNLSITFRRPELLLPSLSPHRPEVPTDAPFSAPVPSLERLQITIPRRRTYSKFQFAEALLKCLESRFEHCSSDLSGNPSGGLQISPLKHLEISTNVYGAAFPPGSRHRNRLQRLISHHAITFETSLDLESI